MKNLLKALLIAVVAVPAAYTAAAWLIGMNVQGQLESREQEVLSSARYVQLTHHEYARGIFSATEQSTYSLRMPLPGAGVIAGSGGGSLLQLTIRNRIFHGPLPNFRSIGLASVDTEFVPPPLVASALASAFGGRPALTFRTKMGWFGGSSAQFSSPAFHVQLPTGGTLSSQGLQGSAENTRGLASWSMHVTSGGFGFAGPSGRSDFGAIGFDAKMRRAFDVIYVGDSALKLARADFEGGNGNSFRLTGLSIRGTSTADSQYVDIAADLSAEEAKTQKLSFSRLLYSMRLSHLDGNSLAALTQALRSAPGAGATPSPAAARDAFNRYGVDILVHDPVIEIPRIAFAMPEGAFQLSAKLAAHGIKREDLSGPGGFMALVPHLDATLDAQVDAALLDKLIASTAQPDQRSAQLAQLERQGLLKRNGATFGIQLGYRAGKLTINGQPYPPAAAPPG